MKKLIIAVCVVALSFCLVGCQQETTITDQGLTVKLNSKWTQTDHQEKEAQADYVFKSDKDISLVVTFCDPNQVDLTLYDLADMLKSGDGYHAKLDTGQRFGLDYYYTSYEYNADTDKPIYGLQYQLIKSGQTNAIIDIRSDKGVPKTEIKEIIDNLTYRYQ